jgi:hypothetical protein
MSRYLVDRIANLPNVTVVGGDHGLQETAGVLDSIRWRQRGGEEIERPIRHLFLSIGAAPNTDWLARVAASVWEGAPVVSSLIAAITPPELASEPTVRVFASRITRGYVDATFLPGPARRPGFGQATVELAYGSWPRIALPSPLGLALPT